MRMNDFIFLFGLLITIPVSGQDFALEQLEQSPRHHEWVQVPSKNGEVSCFVVYPEVSNDATTIVLIHENRGLNEWARSMADQLAAEGYLVVAPDLLSGKAPQGGNTEDFKNSDAARKAIYELDDEQITNDLDAIFDYAQSIPASNGKVAVMGFCWGGSQTFRYATHNPEIAAAFVFYGTGPKDKSSYAGISATVYGFYGGNDQRVNATIPLSEEAMETFGKEYKPEIYEEAGHGFMRSGQAPDASEANQKARDRA
jgi:carboxymethylenebutenolidase